MEEKTFVRDFGRHKGSLRGVIKGRRRRISSWILLGPTSLDYFLAPSR